MYFCRILTTLSSLNILWLANTKHKEHKVATFSDYLKSSLGEVASLIYKVYPYRLQKENLFRCIAEERLINDFAKAKKKIIVICRSFEYGWHPGFDKGWLSATVDFLKKNNVSITIIAEEDPPEIVRELVNAGKVTFKKGESLPLVGHVIDDEIVDISYDRRENGLSPGGNYWRTERAMPDLLGMIEDQIDSSVNYRIKQPD